MIKLASDAVFGEVFSYMEHPDDATQDVMAVHVNPNDVELSDDLELVDPTYAFLDDDTDIDEGDIVRVTHLYLQFGNVLRAETTKSIQRAEDLGPKPKRAPTFPALRNRNS